jgi:MFS family permease
MSFASGIVSLFLAIFMLRHFGQGLMGMTSLTTMMRYVPAHKAKAGALSHMGYSAAEATLPSLIVACLLLFAWRDVWRWLGLFIILVLPLGLSFLLTSHTHEKQRVKRVSAKHSTLSTIDVEATNSSATQWSRAQVVKDPLFYSILPGLTCQSLLYTGFMFHQVHLVESKGWSLTVWASLYLVFSITTLTMSFLLGALVDRFGALRVIPWINLPMMLGLSVLASSSSVLTAGVFMVCMALSTAGQAASGGPFYSERYGNENLGAIKSLGSFYMVLMTAVSPVILGWFIDRAVSINTLAIGGVVYALIVSLVASFGCRAAMRYPYPNLKSAQAD